MPIHPRLLAASLAALLLSFIPGEALSQEGSRTRKRVYDVNADGKEQIAEALARAKAEKKHVLVNFGANWVSWCFALNKMFQQNEQVKAALEKDFVVIAIDVNDGHNRDVDNQYENPTRFGLPTLMVLDAEGKRLTTQPAQPWEDGNDHNPEKFLEWLRQWTPGAKGP